MKELIIYLCLTDTRCGIPLIDNIVDDLLGYERRASGEELAQLKAAAEKKAA